MSERISELFDGETPDQQLVEAIRAATSDAASRELWVTYQQIRWCLRGEVHTHEGIDLRQFQERLAHEPIVFHPKASVNKGTSGGKTVWQAPLAAAAAVAVVAIGLRFAWVNSNADQGPVVVQAALSAGKGTVNPFVSTPTSGRPNEIVRLDATSDVDWQAAQRYLDLHQDGANMPMMATQPVAFKMNARGAMGR